MKIASFGTSSESFEDFFNSVEATEFNLRIRELLIQPINPHHLCPQSLEHILHRVQNMTNKMATVNIDFVESFDGTQTERFFRLLHDAFNESGVEWISAQFVKAIDRRSKGAALDVLERDARCYQLMKDTRDPLKAISIEDIKYIELYLLKHFPANEVKKVAPDGLVEDLAQDQDENSKPTLFGRSTFS